MIFVGNRKPPVRGGGSAGPGISRILTLDVVLIVRAGQWCGRWHKVWFLLQCRWYEMALLYIEHRVNGELEGHGDMIIQSVFESLCFGKAT